MNFRGNKQNCRFPNKIQLRVVFTEVGVVERVVVGTELTDVDICCAFRDFYNRVVAFKKEFT